MEQTRVRLAIGKVFSFSFEPQCTFPGIATKLALQLDPAPSPLHEVWLFRMGAQARGGDSVVESGVAPGEELQAVVGLSAAKVKEAFVNMHPGAPHPQHLRSIELFSGRGLKRTCKGMHRPATHQGKRLTHGSGQWRAAKRVILSRLGPW